MSFQFQTVAAIGPILIETFIIDFTWLGTLIGLYMLPGTVVAIPSGVVGQRFGAKSVVLLGLALMVTGGLMTGVESLQLACAGRLISGVGAVIMNVMLTKMVADWFAEREIVVAMSLVVATWPLGTALGLVLFPIIAGLWSWQAAMYSAVVVALASFALVAGLYREAPGGSPSAQETLRIEMSRREWTLVLIAGSILGHYSASYVVLISFAPELFTVRGHSLQDASRIVSLVGWASILTIPLGGYVAQRIDRPDTIMMAGFAVVALACLALPVTGAFMATFLVIAIVTGLPGGLIMSLAAEALSAQNRAVGMGVFFTCFYACLAILPAAAGGIRDLSGSPSAPVLFAAYMMGASLLGLILFRLAQRWLIRATLA